MKPKNWKGFSKSKKREIADSLLYSHRGHYIVSQALIKAIEVMKKEKSLAREVSNIEDMEILLEIFPIYRIINLMNKEAMIIK